MMTNKEKMQMLKTHWKKIVESLFQSYNNSINFFSLEYWLEFIVRERERSKRENVFGLILLIVPNVDGKSDFYDTFSFIYGCCDLQTHSRTNRWETCLWSAEFIEFRDTYSIIADFSQRFFNEYCCLIFNRPKMTRTIIKYNAINCLWMSEK